jgi:DNA-binding MarR family transcriptional regulator
VPLTPAGEAFTAIVLEVFRLNGSLLEAGDRLTRPVGLTSARWQILGVVDHGPASVAEIARAMGLARQSVQETANGLARDGYVELVDNPADRRAKRVTMRPKGRAALAKIERRHAVWANRLGDRLDGPELRRAAELIGRVREELDGNASARRRAKR